MNTLIHRLVTIPVVTCFTTFCFAHQCESVVTLSQSISSVVSDKDLVDQHVANFCREYSTSAGKGSSAGFGASYRFLSASFGNIDVPAESVASRYCSVSSEFLPSKDAYKQYLESIAPRSYAAYEQCTRMSKLGIAFQMNTATLLPDEFSATVSFVSPTSSRRVATMAVSASAGASCKWDQATVAQRRIFSGSSAVLQCKRADQTKAAYVIVTYLEESKTAMSLPWMSYSKDGVPMEAVANLQIEIANLDRRLSETSTSVIRIESAPSAVVYQCPSGKSPNANPGGGAWGFYGCAGQISTDNICRNIEWPWSEVRECKMLGKLRLY